MNRCCCSGSSGATAWESWPLQRLWSFLLPMNRRPSDTPTPLWRFFRCPSVDLNSNSHRSRSKLHRWFHRCRFLCTIGSSDALGFARPQVQFHVYLRRALHVSVTLPFFFQIETAAELPHPFTPRRRPYAATRRRLYAAIHSR